MRTYESFYRKQGIRLVRDLLEPATWSPDAIFFPYNTMLFWPNPTMTSEYPSQDSGIFKNAHKPYAYTVSKYTMDQPYGNPRHREHMESKLIAKSRKVSPNFKYVKMNSTVAVAARSEVVISLGLVNSTYKYTAHPLTTYDIWRNTMTTAFELASAAKSGIARHKYVYLSMPTAIPDRTHIVKHLDEFKRNYLTVYTDYTYFNMLELFRFVNKDYKHLSIINNSIPESEFKYVDLVISINNKLVIVNLEMLAGITDAYSTETALKKYPTNTVTKLIYIFLHRIIEAQAKLSVLEAGTVTHSISGAVTGSTPDDEEDTKVHKLDDIIENDLDTSSAIETEEGDDIDDAVTALEREDTVEDGIVNDVDNFDKAAPIADTTVLTDTIDNLASNKLLTKPTAKSLKEVITKQATAPSPYKDGTKLKDMLTHTESEVVIDSAKAKIADTPSSVDKTANADTSALAVEEYITKTMKKDVLSTIYSTQRGGLVIKDHDVEVTNNVLGKSETHKLTIQGLDGSRSTIRIKLPVVEKDGTFMMSGHKYVMRTQRADTPLKKISNTMVSLNSYYGKLFVSKATYKKDDLGYWFNKKLVAKYDVDPKLKDIASVNVVASEAKVPTHYGMIGRYTKSFTYAGITYSFDYNAREALLPDADLSKLEKSGVLVGAKGKLPVIMDQKNHIHLDGKDLGTLMEILDFDMSKAPIEYCSAKIYKTQVPLCVLLSYYIGFTNLLKYMHAKYEVVDTGKRINLGDTSYRIIFKDKTYVIERDYGVIDLILGGFVSINKVTKEINQVLDSRSGFTALYAGMSLPLLYTNEIALMGNMFIDPMTKQLLEMFKLPTTLKGLLVKSAEVLIDDNYAHPNSMEGSVLKGYERMSGMMYLELVNAMRLNNNKSHFSKSKLTISPYAVMNRISDDSTVVLADDLNPIANLKQKEDVTFLGSGGRKEVTMTMASRAVHVSDIGVISESVKDSGSSGVSAYMSAVPKLASTRGTTERFDPKKDGWGSVLSTSSMLAPFTKHDDPKRTNFTVIQNSHVIPMKEMRAPYVRTGYEAVFSARVGDKFVVTAKDDGVVDSVSKDKLTVTYKKLGKVSYSLKEWTSKEEAGTTYPHKQLPNVSKGDKFTKDTALAYDKSFFEPDLFDPTRVIYKAGTTVNVALLEAPETYEDSGGISSELAERMGATIVKTKSITLTNTDNILNPLKVGDKVEPKTPMVSILDKALSAVNGLDKRSVDILKDLKMLTPKSSYRGKITKLRVFYNCEFSELSRTIKALAKESDAELISETGHTGEVDGGYSIQGIPLEEGGVEIKYYIQVSELQGVGDKAILANQLKFTSGVVFKDPITAEDGSVIDLEFSTRSIAARIVGSPNLIGTSSKLLELVTDQAVKDYFG